MKQKNSSIRVKKNRPQTLLKNNWLRRVYKYRYEYLVFLPILVFFLVFKYGPMYGVVLAFKNYRIMDGVMGSPWLDPWYKNFERMFTSSVFLRSLGNTVVISVGKLVLSTVLPLTFAILLDELPSPGLKKFTQTISYFPYFISWVVLGGIIRMLLSPTNGPINYVIEQLTGTTIHFLAEPSMFRTIIYITYVWQTLGYNTVIYLAAIASVDQEQYEAARLDGASRWQLAWHITIPVILPTVITMILLNIGGIMSAGFDQIFNLYSPMTYVTGDVINTYVHRIGIEDMQYSYSTAVGLFQNIVGLILVIISNCLVKRLDPESSLF